MIIVPKEPEFDIVYVPSTISSEPSRLLRARVETSRMANASEASDMLSASLTTGTTKPSRSRSTAIPRLTRLNRTRLSPSTWALIRGKSAMARHAARATNGR